MSPPTLRLRLSADALSNHRMDLRIGLVILFPLAFVSNALVPTRHMPTILRLVADLLWSLALLAIFAP